MSSVMLIDNEDMVRRGFRHALGDVPDIDVVAEVRAGPWALREAEERRPRVVLADVGRADIAYLRHCVDGGVIALASVDDDELLHRALEAGARGFLLKNVGHEELVGAVRAVARGQAFICAEMTAHLVDRFDIRPPVRVGAGLDSLSGRERQVLQRIACGRSNEEIARDLHLTPATVKSHVSHILAKLRLPNRMHVALFAHGHLVNASTTL